jgi:hypothetical protein
MTRVVLSLILLLAVLPWRWQERMAALREREWAELNWLPRPRCEWCLGTGRWYELERGTDGRSVLVFPEPWDGRVCYYCRGTKMVPEGAK